MIKYATKLKKVHFSRMLPSGNNRKSSVFDVFYSLRNLCTIQAYCTTHLFLDEVKPIKKYIIVKIYEVKNKQTMSVTRTCKCYNSCKNMNI